MERKEINQGNILPLWANNIESVTTWLSHLQQKELNAYSLYRFCEWAKKTPDELLEEKKKNPSANAVEKLLDKFCNDTNFKNAFRYQVSIAVKSYCRWNYVDLAKASGQVILEKKKDYNKLSKESLRKLWNRARNPRDRALIPFVTSTAIAKETLANLTWGLLEEGWETKDLPAIEIPGQLLKGHGIGRYKGVKQVTFLTPEAKAQLLNYKEWLEEKLGRKVEPSEKIWRDIREPYPPLAYDSFSTLISRVAKEAQVSFTWHDGRRWLTTALEQIGLSPNWARVLRGRKVAGSENPYSRPIIEQLRAKFREAVPLLEFTTEAPAISREVEERLKVLEDFKKTLTPEQIEAGKRAGLLLRKKEKAKPDCEEGNCQKIVAEDELAKFLRDGWRVITALPSGKIVVDR